MDDGCAGLDEAFRAVMTVGHEDTVGTDGLGDFKIVQGVADEDDFCGLPIELRHPLPPLLDFAAGKNIVCSD